MDCDVLRNDRWKRIARTAQRHRPCPKIAESGAEVVISPKRNRKVQRDYGLDLYKESNRSERFFSKLKQFRRVATRYDKLRANFTGFVKRAAIAIWLR